MGQSDRRSSFPSGVWPGDRVGERSINTNLRKAPSRGSVLCYGWRSGVSERECWRKASRWRCSMTLTMWVGLGVGARDRLPSRRQSLFQASKEGLRAPSAKEQRLKRVYDRDKAVPVCQGPRDRACHRLGPLSLWNRIWWYNLMLLVRWLLLYVCNHLYCNFM